MARLDPTTEAVGTVAVAWTGCHCMPIRPIKNSQSGRGGLGPRPCRLVGGLVRSVLCEPGAVAAAPRPTCSVLCARAGERRGWSGRGVPVLPCVVIRCGVAPPTFFPPWEGRGILPLLGSPPRGGPGGNPHLTQPRFRKGYLQRVPRWAVGLGTDAARPPGVARFACVLGLGSSFVDTM